MTGKRPVGGLVALALLLALILSVAEPAAAQCAMCRTALESADGARLAGALRAAVAFLLPMPFMAIGAVALILRRRQERQI